MENDTGDVEQRFAKLQREARRVRLIFGSSIIILALVLGVVADTVIYRKPDTSIPTVSSMTNKIQPPLASSSPESP